MISKDRLNVLGQPLEMCCSLTQTGFYRDGFCRTDRNDQGRHIICAVMTEDFLTFTLNQGNDLITPRLEFNFPGLKPGDKWCICALRWKEALEQHVAPPIILAACDHSLLQLIPLQTLEQYALKLH